MIKFAALQTMTEDCLARARLMLDIFSGIFYARKIDIYGYHPKQPHSLRLRHCL